MKTTLARYADAALGLLLALLLSLAAPTNARADDATHADWTTLLAAHVRWNDTGTATTVDYDGFARDRAALDAYLAALAAVPASNFDHWPREARMAFLINAYNAATVALVLDHWPGLASIKDIGGWFSSPWKQRFVPLLGATRTLDEIEHEMLRGAPDFDEPRIHFAVNCASVGCPALRPEAYTGDRLAAQLDDQTRRFLRDRTRNHWDAATATLTLSKIFDWYGEDFSRGGFDGVADFAARHAAELADSAEARGRIGRRAFDIDHGEYDWSLNRSAPGKGAR
jgi:hypothetical protein